MDTDLERLIKWLDSVNVGYDKDSGNDDITIHIMDHHKGVGSYIGFFVYFQFDVSGKFIMMGAGE